MCPCQYVWPALQCWANRCAGHWHGQPIQQAAIWIARLALGLSLPMQCVETYDLPDAGDAELVSMHLKTLCKCATLSTFMELVGRSLAKPIMAPLTAPITGIPFFREMFSRNNKSREIRFGPYGLLLISPYQSARELFSAYIHRPNSVCPLREAETVTAKKQFRPH